MRYESTSYNGSYKVSPQSKATAVTPTVGSVCPEDAAPQRCKRNPKGHPKIGTRSPTPDGFLKSTFLPKLKVSKTLRACQDVETMEEDFYESLFQLANHYGLKPMETRHFGFPYNIALALEDIQKQLRYGVKDFEEVQLVQQKGKTYLKSEERYNTGATLYYIPMVPLYRLTKNRKRKQAAQLLQSVCSYLYHVVGVSYYTNEESYLYWMYDMVTEWVVSDEDEHEDRETFLSEIRQAAQIGKLMEGKIYNPHNLNLFGQRLERFTGRDDFDRKCYEVASEAYRLFIEYPDTTIHRYARPYVITETEEEELVIMDKYISFCGEAQGRLFQSVLESVNAELQEYPQIEEPIITKHFDSRNVQQKSLDFERRVFALMEALICVLNND